MTVVLHAIGTATPPHDLVQERAAEIAAGLMKLPDRRARSLRSLYAQTGVQARSTAIPHDADLPFFRPDETDGPGTAARMDRYRESAPLLAEAACLDCFARASLVSSQVTHLVTVSCTGFHAPGIDTSLIRSLGLSPSVQRTMIGYMGCHGAVNGLRVSAAIAASDPQAVVLLCCVEICSIHFQYRPVEGAVTANALFGDGAAACLVSARGPGVGLTAFGSHLFPDSQSEMGWRVGDHGFVMSLSARVPTLLREHVGDWVDVWLAARGLRRGDIASWAIHPGGPRIVESVRASLGLDPPAVQDALAVLSAHGNMSSPTILFIIRRMLERGVPLPLVALAFGPGLAGEIMLIGAP